MTRPADSPGWPQEAEGDFRPRWMITTPVPLATEMAVAIFLRSGNRGTEFGLQIRARVPGAPDGLGDGFGPAGSSSWLDCSGSNACQAAGSDAHYRR